MIKTARKLIAVLLIVWIPLFSGNALAVSISMQHGSCHHVMADHRDAGHSQHAAHDASCSGVCHQACSCCMTVEPFNPVAQYQSEGQLTPYLFSFYSITAIPLTPPPLARL